MCNFSYVQVKRQNTKEKCKCRKLWREIGCRIQISQRHNSNIISRLKSTLYRRTNIICNPTTTLIGSQFLAHKYHIGEKAALTGPTTTLTASQLQNFVPTSSTAKSLLRVWEENWKMTLTQPRYCTLMVYIKIIKAYNHWKNLPFHIFS